MNTPKDCTPQTIYLWPYQVNLSPIGNVNSKGFSCLIVLILPPGLK